jgi:hypothetical protein
VVQFLHRIGENLAFFANAENSLDGGAGVAGK